MNFSKWSQREQLFAVVVLITAVLLLYGLLRAKPGIENISKLQAEVGTTQEKINKLVIPDPPLESVEELNTAIEETTRGILERKSEVDVIAGRFAPIDSQELQIRISEIARKNMIRIRDRKPYTGVNSANASTRPTRTLGTKAAKRQKVLARQAARKAAKKAATGATKPQKTEVKQSNLPDTQQKLSFEEIMNPPKGSLHDIAELLQQDSQLKRPLQQIVVEGDFRGIQRFVMELEQLPWLLSVVKMDMAISGKEPPASLPQSLTATLVISL